MKSSDLFLSFFILLVFVGIYAFNTFTVGIEKIKKNWAVYRCNPTIMPFASWFGHDPVSNFSYCIQNMQTSYMSYLLKPTEYAFSVVTKMLGNIVNVVELIRQKIASLVNNIKNIIMSIMGTFINIVIQFQLLVTKLKDTIAKVLGMVTTMVYIVDGGVKTGQSVYNGPVGDAVRFMCFHPDTPIKMDDGTMKPMKDIQISEKLDQNRDVIAVMKMKGSSRDTFYKLFSKELDQYIYVTGGHTIKDETTGKFVHVKDVKEAEECPEMDNTRMCCLITDDHLIQVGEYTFWDWDD